MIYVLFICALTSFLSVNAAQRFGPVAVKTENENRLDVQHCCFEHERACGINSSSSIDFKRLLWTNDDMNNISMDPLTNIASVIPEAYNRRGVRFLEMDTVVAVINDSKLHIVSSGRNSALLIPPSGYEPIVFSNAPAPFGVSVGSILLLASAGVWEGIHPSETLLQVRGIVRGDVVNQRVLSEIAHALLPRGVNHNGAVVVAHMQ